MGLTTIQMPAMNTRQFGWVKNRMPNDTQAVPSIFEPEVAARGGGGGRARAANIGSARPRCSRSSGKSTSPGLLEVYLGKTCYKGQQIANEPKDPIAPNNLYEYVPGVHSVRGKFSDRSACISAEVFVSCIVVCSRSALLRCSPLWPVRSSQRRGLDDRTRKLDQPTSQPVDPLVIGACCTALATLIREAHGKPGAKPTWSSGAKTLVGTAASACSLMCYTIGNGTINEL